MHQVCTEIRHFKKADALAIIQNCYLAVLFASLYSLCVRQQFCWFTLVFSSSCLFLCQMVVNNYKTTHFTLFKTATEKHLPLKGSRCNKNCQMSSMPKIKM